MTGSRPERPLYLTFAGLLGEPPGEAHEVRIDAVELAPRAEPVPDAEADPLDEPAFVRPVSGRVRAIRTNRGILLRATLATELGITCSRCLDEMTLPVDVTLDEEILPGLDLATGTPADSGSEPDVLRLDGHHGLDLEPLVRDAAALAVPIAPHCRPDCPGLCPGCGIRLALGAHEHADVEIDPRLEALRGFRVDGDGENG